MNYPNGIDRSHAASRGRLAEAIQATRYVLAVQACIATPPNGKRRAANRILPATAQAPAPWRERVGQPVFIDAKPAESHIPGAR